MLHAKVLQAMADHGLTPVAAVGERFDPTCHHVVEVCDGPGEPDQVVRQLRPGYRWGGTVLRPAEVVAVRHPIPPSCGGPGDVLDRH